MYEVLGIRAIEDREAGREADRLAVDAQEARRHGVERAAPYACTGSRRRQVVGARCGSQESVDASEHLLGSASGEGEEQDPTGRHPPGDKMGDAVGECRGLAGAGTGDDEEWPAPVRCGSTLRVVEVAKQRVDRFGREDGAVASGG